MFSFELHNYNNYNTVEVSSHLDMNVARTRIRKNCAFAVVVCGSRSIRDRTKSINA